MNIRTSIFDKEHEKSIHTHNTSKANRNRSNYEKVYFYQSDRSCFVNDKRKTRLKFRQHINVAVDATDITTTATDYRRQPRRQRRRFYRRRRLLCPSIVCHLIDLHTPNRHFTAIEISNH